MKRKSFKNKDSLDKFLTVYLQLLDNTIETCTDDLFRDLYVKEKQCILSVVDFVRAVDSYSKEELLKQLKAFDRDPNLKLFITQLTSDYNFDRSLADNTTKHFGELKTKNTQLLEEK